MSDTLSPQILAMEQQLQEAQRLNDVAALEYLLHDDLIFIDPTGKVITKDDDLEQHAQKLLRLDRQDAGEMLIYFQGPQTSVVTLPVFLSGSYAGQAFSGHFRYMRVWQRQYDGNWQIIAGSCVPVL